MKKCPFCAEEIQDAAIICRFCNREVTPAVASKPVTPKTSRKWIWFLAVGIPALWLLALMLGPPSASDVDARGGRPAPTADSYKPAEISATVSFQGGQFVVTNTGADVWREVRFAVNATGGMRGGYEYSVDQVQPRQTVRTSSLEFATSDGTRFNPYAVKPKTFTIAARVNSHGEWRRPDLNRG